VGSTPSGYTSLRLTYLPALPHCAAPRGLAEPACIWNGFGCGLQDTRAEGMLCAHCCAGCAARARYARTRVDGMAVNQGFYLLTATPRLRCCFLYAHFIRIPATATWCGRWMTTGHFCCCPAWSSRAVCCDINSGLHGAYTAHTDGGAAARRAKLRFYTRTLRAPAANAGALLQTPRGGERTCTRARFRGSSLPRRLQRTASMGLAVRLRHFPPHYLYQVLLAPAADGLVRALPGRAVAWKRAGAMKKHQQSCFATEGGRRLRV